MGYGVNVMGETHVWNKHDYNVNILLLLCKQEYGSIDSAYGGMLVSILSIPQWCPISSQQARYGPWSWVIQLAGLPKGPEIWRSGSNDSINCHSHTAKVLDHRNVPWAR